MPNNSVVRDRQKAALFGGPSRQTLELTCHQAECPWPKNNHRTRKWRVGCGLPKPQPQASAQQSDLALHRVAVPPVRIGARRDKANNRRAFLRRAVCLPHPIAALAVRRIHEHGFCPPILQKPVFLHREVTLAFVVRPVRARVKREAELFVQRVKQPLRRGPYVGFGFPARR